MTAAHPTPTVPGFYWARWLRADPGTDDDGAGCLGEDADWEVVEVCENSLDPDDPEYLAVAVAGVAAGQPPANFAWGPPVPRPADLDGQR